MNSVPPIDRHIDTTARWMLESIAGPNDEDDEDDDNSDSYLTMLVAPEEP